MSKEITPMPLPVDATFVFSQPEDCCASGDNPQILTVETHDGGGGNYLTIQTSRWALGEEDLEPFIERLRWCLHQVRSVFDEDEKHKE